MKNTTESPVEDIADIKQEPIIIPWDENKSLHQISEETGLPVDVINKKLKLIQKALVKRELERQRANHYEKKGHS